MRRIFGSEARYLIVEALLDEGVVVSPLVKYIDFNMRVCRPVGLSREQIETVLDYVISRVGFTYDRPKRLKNCVMVKTVEPCEEKVCATV